MNFTTIDQYINNLHFNEPYKNLPLNEKESIVFTAHELLKDHFPERKIIDRAVALQVLFMLEGETEEYAKLKRHGVKSYAVKGVSVSLEGSNIAPIVIDLLGAGRASLGRLI